VLGTDALLDTLDVLTLTCSGERAGTRITFLGRKTAAGGHLVGDRNRFRACGRLPRRRRFDGWRGCGSLGLRAAAELTRPALFDDNRLRTAVAEILSDVAAFDRPLQRQRLARAPAEGLVGGVLRLCHALPVKLRNHVIAGVRMR
jgi:hypothetical protein